MRTPPLLLLLLAAAPLDAAAPPVKARPRITPANAARLQLVRALPVTTYKLTWSRDGTQLAAVRLMEGVEVFDAESFRHLRTVAQGREVTSFAFGPVGDTVATSEAGTEAAVLNLRTLRSQRFDTGNRHPRVAFSTDGKVLGTGGYGQDAMLWDLATGKLITKLNTGKQAGGLTVEFSPNSKLVAVGNRNSSTTVFDLTTGRQMHVLEKKMTHELRFHADGTTLAVSYFRGEVALWDAAAGKLLREVKTDAQHVNTLDWSPRGDLLATAGGHGSVSLWEPKKLSLVARVKAPEWVTCVRFSPDGTRLLAAGGSERLASNGVPIPGAYRNVQVFEVPE
jgi:WD40 repeat protein